MIDNLPHVCVQLMFGTRGMQLRATLPFYFSKHFLRHPAGLADLGSPDLEDLKGATCFPDRLFQRKPVTKPGHALLLRSKPYHVNKLQYCTRGPERSHTDRCLSGSADADMCSCPGIKLPNPHFIGGRFIRPGQPLRKTKEQSAGGPPREPSLPVDVMLFQDQW